MKHTLKKLSLEIEPVRNLTDRELGQIAGGDGTAMDSPPMARNLTNRELEQIAGGDGTTVAPPTMDFALEEVRALKQASQYKLSADMLHKESPEDVLLCYGHGSMPARLRTSDLRKLNDSDIRFLARYYEACPDIDDPANNDPYRYNTSVPARLSGGEAVTLQETEEGRRILEQCYRKVGNDYTVNVDYVPEIDEIFMLRALHKSERWIHDVERGSITTILEAAGIPENNPRILYVSFYNDLNNYFFYKKHHEHVPGMMTIEAGRQTVYAHFYRYSGIKRGEVSISIANLSTNFYAYTDSNYPVRIVVEDVDPSMNPHKWLHKRATFYQRGMKIAQFELTGPVTQMSKFKKRRLVPINEAHDFEPVKNVRRTLYLTAADGKTHECELRTLSAKRCHVKFKAGTLVQLGETFSVALYAKVFGDVTGQAQIVDLRDTGKGMTAELQIAELGPQDQEKLSEIVKNFTHVVVKNDIF